MILQLARRGETPVTVWAGVGLLAGVRQHMHIQFAQQGKLLGAFLTMKWRVARVNFHMLLQGVYGREGFVTL
jgi:hypothetical protein